jgi:hypothetical protein
MMGQAKGEKNPACSIATATDTKSDIITHFIVNLRGRDVEALKSSIAGIRANPAGRHRIVVADTGFAAIENLENLEANNQMALIPDQRIKTEAKRRTWRGEFDRSKFHYQGKADRYICPKGTKLTHARRTTINGRLYMLYSNPGACR